jgi:hypothetical protein
VSAALPSNGNANTLANKALHISAPELRSFMRMSPLFYWKNGLRPFFGHLFGVQPRSKRCATVASSLPMSPCGI